MVNPMGLESTPQLPHLRSVKPFKRSVEDTATSTSASITSSHVAQRELFYCDFEQLNELIETSRCEACGESMQVTDQNGHPFTREGLCISVILSCKTGRHRKRVWKSSPQSAGGGLVVNRLVCSTFFVCGIEHNDFLEPHSACGMAMSEKSYERHIDRLEKPILQQEKESYEAAREIANFGGVPLNVLIDGQWSNPQKAGRPARQCTNPAIIGTPGLPGLVIDQQHVTADSLEADGLPASRSKDVEGLRRAAENLPRILTNVASVTVDPCSSGPKAVREFVEPKFPDCKTFLCAWHEENNVRKDFKRTFLDARTPLAKKQGNRQYVPTYPDAAVLGITMQAIRNHRRFCVESARGNLEACKKLWLNALPYFAAAAHKKAEDLDRRFVADFQAWLQKHAGSLEFIINGFRTDLVESYHHFSTVRYLRKGSHHSDRIYRLRRALAMCHWNEIQMARFYERDDEPNECVNFRRNILKSCI